MLEVFECTFKLLLLTWLQVCERLFLLLPLSSKRVHDRLRELPGGGEPAQVPRLDLPLPEHRVHRRLDPPPLLGHAHVLQHLGGAEEHRRGVGHVLAHPLVEGVLGTGLEHGHLGRVAGAGGLNICGKKTKSV